MLRGSIPTRSIPELNAYAEVETSVELKAITDKNRNFANTLNLEIGFSPPL